MAESTKHFSPEDVQNLFDKLDVHSREHRGKMTTCPFDCHKRAVMNAVNAVLDERTVLVNSHKHYYWIDGGNDMTSRPCTCEIGHTHSDPGPTF